MCRAVPLLLAGLFLATLPLRAQKTRALVVGISKYADASNPAAGYENAHLDAERFARFLLDFPGSTVQKEDIVLLVNEQATLGKINAALDWLVQVTENGDRAVIYFFGAGKVEYETYWLSYDSPATGFPGKALPVSYFQSFLVTLNVGTGAQVVTILPRPTAGGSLMDRATYRGKEREIRLFGPPSDSDPSNSSLFTSTLIDGLKGQADLDGDRTISLFELRRHFEDTYAKFLGAEAAAPMILGPPEATLAIDPGSSLPDQPDSETGEFSFRELESDEPLQEVASPKLQVVFPDLPPDQALITPHSSITIELEAGNAIERILINREKLVDLQPGAYSQEIALEPGLNEIRISALNGFKSEVQTLFVYSTNSIFIGPESKHYALFIATDTYTDPKWTKLNNPRYDAREVAGVLAANYGFEVDTLMNPSKTAILSKLRDYALRFDDPNYLERNDHLLIYLSGHGAWDPGFRQGHLVAADSKFDDPVFESYLSYADLQNKIDNLKIKHILVVVDACFGGTFDLSLAAKAERSGPQVYSSVSTTKFREEKLRYATRKVLAAGRDVPVYDGLARQHSPFTAQFLQALDIDPQMEGRTVTFERILQFVEKCDPVPHPAVFGKNEPGSNFLFYRRN